MPEYVYSNSNIHSIGEVNGDEIDSIIKTWITKDDPGVVIFYGNGKMVVKKFSDIEKRDGYFYRVRCRLC